MIKPTFARQLNNWYRRNARDLPWRKTRDPYKIWISEIMLQQTTVATVIDYYNKWIKKYPTIKHVARSSESSILKSWQGLGYYSRARNILKSSKIIIKEFDSKIPSKRENLAKLPGFGPYTVGAVLSIAYDKREPIVDANVRRVFMRLLAIEKEANTKVDEQIYKQLDKVMPKSNLKIFNQALMELGAMICKASEPVCSLCPVQSSCLSYKKGIQELIPHKRIKNITEINASIAVIKRKNKYLIQQRPNKGLLAGLWEFPGGKIENNESPVEALKREVKEEVGIRVSEISHIVDLKHYYTTFKVNLHVFNCTPLDSVNELRNRKWLTAKELRRIPMPSGSAKILNYLK